MDKATKDWCATFLGLLIIAIGVVGHLEGQAPWEVMVGMSAWGSYLTLPRRMRFVGDSILLWAKQAIELWNDFRGGD